ncbi:MAG: flagellar biosynthetic protein FliO [Gammaproteobacteria bacterium]|nr:flagellar biosynthetic protein FliO [Gammaproteobacteria bacterium]
MNKIIMLNIKKIFFFLSIVVCCTVSAGEEANTDVTSKAITSTDSIANLLQLSIGLGIVLVAIFALAWFVKRVAKVDTAIGGAFKVIAVLSVGQRERIVLVQVGEHQIVLGVAPGHVRKIHLLDESIQDPNQNQKPLSGSFSARLQAALNQRFSS